MSKEGAILKNQMVHLRESSIENFSVFLCFGDVHPHTSTSYLLSYIS